MLVRTIRAGSPAGTDSRSRLMPHDVQRGETANRPVCILCRRPQPVASDDSACCPLCNYNRLRIADLAAGVEATEAWRLAAETVGEAWLMDLAMGEKPVGALNDTGTLMYGIRGNPFVPESNRRFDYEFVSMLNNVIDLMIGTSKDYRSWPDLDADLETGYDRQTKAEVLEYVVGRLAERPYHELSLLAMGGTNMVVEAARLALAGLKQADLG